MAPLARTHQATESGAGMSRAALQLETRKGNECRAGSNRGCGSSRTDTVTASGSRALISTRSIKPYTLIDIDTNAIRQSGVSLEEIEEGLKDG